MIQKYVDTITGQLKNYYNFVTFQFEINIYVR